MSNTEATLSVQGAPSGWISQLWFWLFKTRNGYLSLWCVFAVSTLVGILWLHAFGPARGILDSLPARTAFIGATSALVLPVLLFFLNSKDNLQQGPSLALPVLSLFVLVLLTGIAAFDAVLAGGVLLGRDLTPANSAQLAARIVFFVFLAVSFIPNVWNAAIFAEFEEKKLAQVARAKDSDVGRKMLADDASEAISALITTVIVLLIGVLAYFAGGVGSSLAFENFYGLVLCGIVIGVFAIVVFLDTLAETEAVQALSRAFGWFALKMRFLARFYNWIDTGFVRIGAGVAGMGHETVLRRYGLLAGSLTCLTLLAWFLPPPLGLIPAMIGFVLAISVSRLWSWVEDDRALAAMTEYKYDAPYRVGFREDFRDETLLGFMFVFTLLPIAMMQAHFGQVFGPSLFDDVQGKSFQEWFGFFGLELAKAVPIVDWAEIYGVRRGSNLIEFNSPPARHAVFLARAMVDLVLIASLLQAIGIASRNRNQKRLYAAGHIDRLDELVERYELSKAVRESRRNDVGISNETLMPLIAIKAFDLMKLSRTGIVDFRRYSEARLRHLYWSVKDLETRSFIAALSADASRFPLSSAIDQTKEIAAGHQNEVDMVAAFGRAVAEHKAGINLIDVGDLYQVLFDIREKSGLRDFKWKMIELAAEIGPPEEVLDKLSGLAGGPNGDGFQYTKRRLAEVIRSQIPLVTDRNVLAATLAEWEGWAPATRPGGGEYEKTLEALRSALRGAK